MFSEILKENVFHQIRLHFSVRSYIYTAFLLLHLQNTDQMKEFQTKHIFDLFKKNEIE